MIKKITTVVIFILLLLFATLYFIVGTNYGLNLALQVTNKLIPGALHFSCARGTLGKSLTIENINYQTDESTISAKKLSLTWQWWTLLTSLNTPLKLDIHNANIKLNKKTLVNINNISLAGNFSLNDNSELKLFSDQVNYHLTTKEILTAHHLNADITGHYDNYQANITLKTTTTDILGVRANNIESSWHVKAQGNTEAIESLTVQSDLLKGQFTLAGKLSWLPHLSWQTTIKAKHLNPAVYDKNLSGNIHINLDSQGKIDETGTHVRLEIKDISGYLLDYPLLIKGGFIYQPKKISITHFSLMSGDNTIKSTGEITNNENIHIAGQLPHLEQLIPQMKGRADFSANITGTGDNPYIKVNAKANDVSFKEFSIKNTQLNVAGYALTSKPMKMTIEASQIKANAQVIDNVKATFTKQNNHFNFQSTLHTPDIALQTALSASKNKDHYKGALTILTLTQSDQKVLHLKTPIHFTATQHSLNIQPACIYSTFGSTCIKQFDLAENNTQLTGDIVLSADDFSYLATLMPRIQNPQGKLSINMHLKGTTEKPILTGNSQFTGSVAIPYLKIKLNPITINAQGSEQGLITYKASITSKSPLNITGTTEVNNDFKTTMNFNGKDFEVANNSEANITISPDIHLNYQNNLIEMQGSIDIPYAKITPIDFTSTTTLPADVVIVDKQQAQKQIVNLNSKISINLGNNIIFSYAGLTAKLSGSITVIDRPGGDTTATGTLSIDKGQYKAYGQDLTIRQGRLIYTGGPVTDPGLNIEAIRPVTIVTADTGNTSTSDKQVVGVRIQGNAEAPKLTLFSEPSGLSQSDILSYLILGRGTGQAGNVNAGTLVSALSYLNLGSHSENSIKNQLNHSLGLDIGLDSEEVYDADADSGNVVNNTSLMLGKSITSKLKVNYSLGIIVPINILTITYELSKRFSLKSNASSDGTGVDIFYHYSKD